MRTVEHYRTGSQKLLRIETDGCAVNIVVGVHAENGAELTVVEVEARHPDEDAAVWEIDGPSVIVVRRIGVQVMAGDSPSRPDREPAVTSTRPDREADVHD